MSAFKWSVYVLGEPHLSVVSTDAAQGFNAGILPSFPPLIVHQSSTSLGLIGNVASSKKPSWLSMHLRPSATWWRHSLWFLPAFITPLSPPSPSFWPVWTFPINGHSVHPVQSWTLDLSWRPNTLKALRTFWLKIEWQKHNSFTESNFPVSFFF